MSKKKSYLTTSDHFCGCGGSGSGAKKALDKVGGEILYGANHWKLAIESYASNKLSNEVECTDLSAADPRRFPSTDISLWSPECTTHTPAGGNTHKQLKKQMDMFNKNIVDPATERSRATMWDVCRFAEYHKYRAMIVENVVEAKTRWVLFEHWLRAMHILGYDHKCVYHNSMFSHPTPQSRDRMYVVFWLKGTKAPNLEFTPKAYCYKCTKDVFAIQVWKNPQRKFGKYKQQYVYACPDCQSLIDPYYYAAFNCIDWTDIGTRIGDRKKPLSDNTVKRIEYGLDKYGNYPLMVVNQGESMSKLFTQSMNTMTTQVKTGVFNPFVVNICNGGNKHSRTKSVMDEGFTQTTFDSHGIVNSPFVLKVEHGSQLESARGVNDELQTQCVRQTAAIVVPPFIINDQQSTGVNFRVRGMEEAAQTISTQVHFKLIAPPFLIEMHRTGKSRKITDTVNTATSKGVKTGLITMEGWNSFLAANYNGSHCVKHFTEETGSMTAKERHALITYKKPNIEDCYYRMLKAKEIKLAMAFDSDYTILGNAKDQVRQLGNAVTPPAMEWLTERCIETLM